MEATCPSCRVPFKAIAPNLLAREMLEAEYSVPHSPTGASSSATGIFTRDFGVELGSNDEGLDSIYKRITKDWTAGLQSSDDAGDV